MLFARPVAFSLGRFLSSILAAVTQNTRTVATQGYGAAAATTGATTASGSGGSGSYSYAWSCTNGWVANSPFSATTTFTSPAINHGASAPGVATVTVTDLISGNTATATVTLNHTREVEPLMWVLSPANQQVYGDGVPGVNVRGVWTVIPSGGSGSYTVESSFIPSSPPVAGGASGATLDVTLYVEFGTSTGGIWIIDIADNYTGQSLHLERGMTFTNPSGN